MRLCHIVPSLEERHGGPSKSVRALVTHLRDNCTHVDLFATAAPPTSSLTDNREPDAPIFFPRVIPRWLCRSPALRTHLERSDYDYYHHHSLWLLTLDYTRQAAQKNSRPMVISPRGMMSPWAYQHRRWRKRLAEALVHPGAFTITRGWHATSEEEASDIRRLGFKQPICVSPNGVFLPSESELTTARTYWHEQCPATRKRPVALFYSRFHRKKRLLELIDLWLSAPRGDWLLLIVGIAEDYTATSLQAEVAARDGSTAIAIFDGDQCPAPYAVASLFLLPSHSENFGLVIAEALAARVPCLVTDTTPWQGLNTRHAGWCGSWENYPTALAHALNTLPEELKSQGANARDWMAAEFSWSQVAARLRDFYPSLCA